MVWILEILWLIPALPLTAAAVTALARRPQHRFAATLAIGSMILAFALSCVAFVSTLGGHTGMEVERQGYNFDSLQFGGAWRKLGWVSHPLPAVGSGVVRVLGVGVSLFSVRCHRHGWEFSALFGFRSSL